MSEAGDVRRICTTCSQARPRHGEAKMCRQGLARTAPYALKTPGSWAEAHLNRPKQTPSGLSRERHEGEEEKVHLWRHVVGRAAVKVGHVRGLLVEPPRQAKVGQLGDDATGHAAVQLEQHVGRRQVCARQNGSSTRSVRLNQGWGGFGGGFWGGVSTRGLGGGGVGTPAARGARRTSMDDAEAVQVLERRRHVQEHHVHQRLHTGQRAQRPALAALCFSATSLRARRPSCCVAHRLSVPAVQAGGAEAAAPFHRLLKPRCAASSADLVGVPGQRGVVQRALVQDELERAVAQLLQAHTNT